MERFRWPFLFVGAAIATIAGVVSYHFVGNNTPEVVVMGLMLVAVIWFLWSDWVIDSYRP